MTANHIILISIDNLRFDCIGYQPDKRELKKYDVLKYLETPTLDRIAEKSLCFTQCISTNTYTTAAHASVFTGLYPSRHGVREFYGNKLSPNVFTLAETLKVFGYETVIMTDIANLFLPLDLNRGFNHFFHGDDRALLKFLADNRDKRIFLFAHFFDVHEPFLFCENPEYDNSDYRAEIDVLYRTFGLTRHRVPADSDKASWRRLIDLIGYKDHVNFLPLFVRGATKFDRGRFSNFISGLETMGMMEESLLVIFSDHGEGRSSPDGVGFSHGGMLFDSVIRVPLIIRHSDLPKKITDRLVSIVDIFPTILNLVLNGDGRDTLPYVLDGIDLTTSQPGGERTVYSETWQRDNHKLLIPMMFISSMLQQRAVRTKDSKYIINGKPELLSRPDMLKEIDDDAFLQYIYRGLYGRFEDFDEYRFILRDLADGVVTRDKFLKRTLNSVEYKSKPQYIRYDLLKDPLEERPINAGTPVVRDESEHYFDTIGSISKSDVTSEEVFPEAAETISEIVRKACGEGLESQAYFPIIKNKHLFSCILDDFIVHSRSRKLRYSRKKFQHEVLHSEEFRLFLREYLSERTVTSSGLKRRLRTYMGYIPYDMQRRIYDFLELKVFPKNTLRGRMWNALLSKIFGT